MRLRFLRILYIVNQLLVFGDFPNMLDIKNRYKNMEKIYTFVETLLILSWCAEESSGRLLKAAEHIAKAYRQLRGK